MVMSGSDSPRRFKIYEMPKKLPGDNDWRTVRRICRILNERYQQKTGLMMSDIIDAICLGARITLRDLQSDSRCYQYARPRIYGMVLARVILRKSYKQIGGAFCRDYSTVVYAYHCYGAWVRAVLDTTKLGKALASIPDDIRRTSRVGWALRAQRAGAMNHDHLSSPA